MPKRAATVDNHVTAHSHTHTHTKSEIKNKKKKKSTVQYSSVHYSTTQYSPVQLRTLQCHGELSTLVKETVETTEMRTVRIFRETQPSDCINSMWSDVHSYCLFLSKGRHFFLLGNFAPRLPLLRTIKS